VIRRGALACLAAAALLCAAAARADDDALPPVQHSGDISYISGGVGLDESDAIKAAGPKYPLWISFTSRVEGKDAYTAPDQVTILKAGGAPVLDLKPNGPFLLLDLPPGRYQVSAGFAAQSRTQKVQIARGAHKRLVFSLPEPAAQ
jgi:hypothetical protein